VHCFRPAGILATRSRLSFDLLTVINEYSRDLRFHIKSLDKLSNLMKGLFDLILKRWKPAYTLSHSVEKFISQPLLAQLRKLVVGKSPTFQAIHRRLLKICASMRDKK